MSQIWIFNQELTTPHYGYVHHRHYYLAQEYCVNDNEVLLVGATCNHFMKKHPPSSKLFNFEKVKSNFEIVWLRVPKYSVANSLWRIIGWFQYTILASLLILKRRQKPEVIIVSCTAVIPILAALFLKIFYKSKIIYEVRDIWPLTLVEIGGYSENNLLIRVLGFLEKLAYNYSDHIVSTLPNCNQHITEILGSSNFKFECIPQGFNTEILVTSEQIDLNETSDYFSDSTNFIVGYAGTIGLSNNLDVLVSVAEKLNASYPKIKFLIAGDGPSKNELIERAESLQNVHFIDFISKNKVINLLSNCDVLYDTVKSVDLYKYGLSRNKWIDYMLAGKPIVASYSGFKSMINECDGGYFVDSENVNQLEELLIKLYMKPREELKRIGNNAYNYVKNNRQYKDLAVKYLKIIKEFK